MTTNCLELTGTGMEFIAIKIMVSVYPAEMGQQKQVILEKYLLSGLHAEILQRGFVRIVQFVHSYSTTF